ncbi:MAG: hypothetical protein LH614_17775 [Pyrinomonadaceae bacterium]|nr:hypothetical protein [Pyrinomonadaceae bacterium]
MEIKRTTEIFVETNRRLVIRQPESAEHFLCPNCNDAMLAAEQIAVVFGISRRAVYQIIETEAAHFVETETGFLLVCPNSLAKILANRTETLGEKL